MIYVSSDWHGCAPEKIQRLLAMAEFSESDYLFVLGDVIDRGEHGVAHLKWLMEQPNVALLLGNHEAMMLQCRFALEDDTREYTEAQTRVLRRWLDNGGHPTLDGLSCLSYRHATALLDQVEQTPLYVFVEVKGQRYLLTHSGLGNFHPDKPIEQYTERELLWHRPEWEDSYFPDTVLVFEHTPARYMHPMAADGVLRTKTWIDIDTGAAMGKEPTLLCLDSMEEFRLT